VFGAELRTMSYEIVRQQKDTVLDFLEKNYPTALRVS
jgi:hypothetical protein